MKEKQIKQLGLLSKERIDIAGVFTYPLEINDKASIFTANLGKNIIPPQNIWKKQSDYILNGNGFDHMRSFKLTGYDPGPKRYLLKEQNSEITIYRYDLSSILPDFFVGDWYKSSEPNVAKINNRTIEADTAFTSGYATLNPHGRFCFTISNYPDNSLGLYNFIEACNTVFKDVHQEEQRLGIIGNILYQKISSKNLSYPNKNPIK